MVINKKLSIFLASLIVVLGLLAGCSSNNSASDKKSSTSSATKRTLTDTAGHHVTIPTHPKRIIAPYLEDDLAALGVTPVAQWSLNNGKDVQNYLQGYLKNVSTVPYDLPFEAVSSFNPDLILINSPALAAGNKYQQYSKIAPTYVMSAADSNDWRKQLQEVGKVLGKKDKANKILKDYDATAATAKKKIEQKAGHATAAALWLTNNKCYIVSESLSSGTVLYHDLGFTAPKAVQDISKKATASWSEISLEKLAQLDADYIFLVNSDKGSGAKLLKDSLYKNIPAVKNNHVYQYSSETSWLYSGPIANKQIISNVLNNLTHNK